MFPLGEDTTEYKLVSRDYVNIKEFHGKDVLTVEPQALTLLANTAFKEMALLYRSGHLANLKAIIDDPESSYNDRYIALELLKNAAISAEMVYPMCQDTGTAIVMGKKGQQVWTWSDDKEELSKGVFEAYTENYLRYSQNAPITMYEEKNTRCNLPAQIDLFATQGDEYRFLFMAKGGGSANKTFLYQMTKAVLNSEEILLDFMTDKMKSLGTAACPPYSLSFVIGGTSAETNLKTVKLASARYYDALPTTGDDTGHAFRDVDLEKKVLDRAHNLGLGAQFGGKHFALDVRVVRLPRRPADQGSHHLFCRACQDPGRPGLRILRPYHGRPDGPLCAHLPGAGGVHGHAGQGQPFRPGDRCLQKSPGGPAARLGRDFIKKVELVEYEEFGMEAVFMMMVEDFPAFIIVDERGNDFYSNLL
jgi:fumarate hydratase class I